VSLGAGNEVNDLKTVLLGLLAVLLLFAYLFGVALDTRWAFRLWLSSFGLFCQGSIAM